MHLFGEGPGHAVAFPKRGVKDFVNLFLGDALPLQPSAQGSVEVVQTLAFDGWEVPSIVPMLIHPMGGLALESVLIDDGPGVLRIGTPDRDSGPEGPGVFVESWSNPIVPNYACFTFVSARFACIIQDDGVVVVREFKACCFAFEDRV